MMGFGGQFLSILVFIAENAGHKTIAVNPHKKRAKIAQIIVKESRIFISKNSFLPIL
jgi:hypothetical protein